MGIYIIKNCETTERSENIPLHQGLNPSSLLQQSSHEEHSPDGVHISAPYAAAASFSKHKAPAAISPNLTPANRTNCPVGSICMMGFPRT